MARSSHNYEPLAGIDVADVQRLREKLWDPLWRLNNLYKIQDKMSRVVPFVMNAAQKRLQENIWYLNIILKARQLGFSTFILLKILDKCLFNKNIQAGITAHTREAGAELMRNKIIFPYENMHPIFRDIKSMQTSVCNSEQIVFNNGSSIRVSTSFVSGTLQYLHISELGKICKFWPEKAEEIKTGSLNTVEKGNIVFIESTAEGRTGYFHELCTRALNDQKMGKILTPLDFRFHFFPWFEDPGYALEVGQELERDEKEQELEDNDRFDEEPIIGGYISKEMHQYFDTLREKEKIELNEGQKRWYVAKKVVLGDKMKSQYPATPDEAFEASILGAYYSQQMSKLREQGRLTKVPYTPGYRVHTAWDIGFRDSTSIWFFQGVGREVRFIDYYEANNEELAHYVKEIRKRQEKLGWMYGQHIGPHDLKKTDFGTGKTLLEQALSLGIRFKIAPKLSTMDGIEQVRNLLAVCWIDQEHCERGVMALDEYRKEWNDIKGDWQDKPFHDWSSHGADAMRYAAVGMDLNEMRTRTMEDDFFGPGAGATGLPAHAQHLPEIPVSMIT